MGQELLDFFSGNNIEVAVGLSSEQDCLPTPRYDVKLRKGVREESFVILGDPESEQRMDPEDVFRALLIRIQMHENSACLSSPMTLLYRETASRLKDLLGNNGYYDFLNMSSVRRRCKRERFFTMNRPELSYK